MKNQNMLTITLIIAGLSFSPIMAEEIQYIVTKQKTIKQTISSNIAKILHKRGLDEEVAAEMAENFLSHEDEILLAILIQNLENHNIVTRDEVLEYLSDAALHRQKINVKSYDHILGMVSNIRHKALDEPTRKMLSQLVKINKQLFV